jgi:hypothetical protein
MVGAQELRSTEPAGSGGAAAIPRDLMDGCFLKDLMR